MAPPAPVEKNSSAHSTRRDQPDLIKGAPSPATSYSDAIRSREPLDGPKSLFVQTNPGKSTKLARGSRHRATAMLGSSFRSPRRYSNFTPQSPSRYNGLTENYPDKMVINIPCAPIRVRCTPFTKEFTRLGTHTIGVPRQWKYFTPRSRLPLLDHPRLLAEDTWHSRCRGMIYREADLAV